MTSPLARSLALLVALSAGAIACGDLKTASPADGGASDGGGGPSVDGGTSGSGGKTPDGSGEGDASSTKKELPPGTGPGTWGALPSGYCCTDDSECRYRHCADIGGGQKACLDTCYDAGICQRPDIAFTCDAPDHYTPGMCRPPAGFACLDPATFVRGTRAVGDCCAATGDGTAGEECDGNMCIAIGDGPFVCTHRCTSSKDCPGGTICQRIADYAECVPANDPYTCN